jgi:chromate transport protein ChrA
MKFVLLLSSLTIVFLFGPLLKLLQFNQLYFGGTHNFFDDTIYSLVYYSTISMGILDFEINAIFLIVVILMALIIAIQLIKLFKHKTKIESSFFIVSLVIIMLIQITFFYFFNTKYLIQRTALLLIPIFIFSLLGFVNDLGNIVIYFAAGFVSLFMFYLTLRFIPMDNSLNWQYDADNEKLLSELKTIYKKSDTQNKLSLGVDWIFQPSLNFYRATTDASSWLDTIVKEGYDYKKYEYYFVESASINKFVDTTQFRVLKTFPQSNNLLIKNLKFE